MITRQGSAKWTDNLKDGKGSINSKSYQGSYSFASRFENGDGVSPEELIGDAHAGCYSMALAHELDQAGYTPVSVETTADVHFDPDALEITRIDLQTVATVNDIDEDTFLEIANAAKEGCPVSKALAATDINLASAQLQT